MLKAVKKTQLSQQTEAVRGGRQKHRLFFLTFVPYITLQQRFSNCGPRTTSGPRVLPLWSF